jgi:hypothetical protein
MAHRVGEVCTRDGRSGAPRKSNARAVGWHRILPMELHLQRADRIIQAELAEERAERRSPHMVLRPAPGGRSPEDPRGARRAPGHDPRVRRALRGQPRIRRVRWENKLWRLVRELRARLEASPAPKRLYNRRGAAAVSPGEPVGADRQGSMAAAAAGVSAEILAAYQAEDP